MAKFFSVIPSLRIAAIAKSIRTLSDAEREEFGEYDGLIGKLNNFGLIFTPNVASSENVEFWEDDAWELGVERALEDNAERFDFENDDGDAVALYNFEDAIMVSFFNNGKEIIILK